MNGSYFHPFQNKKKTKTFEIINNEEVYQQIKDHKMVDLRDKYLENFSFSELTKFDSSLSSSEIECIFADRAFLENISFNKAVFRNCGASFCGTIFGEGPVNFFETNFQKGEVSFLNAQFINSQISFEKAQFGECRVLFYETKFGDGLLNFKKAIFEGDSVSFQRANFGNGDVRFHFAQFGNDTLVDFSESVFGKGLVDFSATLFSKSGSTNFTEVDFGEGDVNFQYSKFGTGNVLFLKTNFKKGNVSFNGAQFENSEVDFTETQFGEGQVYFWNTLIKSDWYLESIKAESIDLSGARIHGTISFLDADIKELRLESAKLTGRIFIKSRELKLNGKLESSSDIINIQANSSYKVKAEQFRLLKENFRNLGQYDDEDIAYVQFKRNELLQTKQSIDGKVKETYQKIKKNYPGMPEILVRISECKHNYHYFKFFTKKLVFQDIGRFGTSPRYLAKFMGKTIVGFSILYYLIFLLGFPLFEIKNGLTFNWFNCIPYSFFFSVTTFFTLSFNQFQPGHPILILLAGLEGGVGLFLMAYFTVAFVRKLLR